MVHRWQRSRSHRLCLDVYVALFVAYLRYNELIHPDTIDENTPNSHIYGFSILVGVGTGCYIVAGFPIAQSLVRANEVADALGAMTICNGNPNLIFMKQKNSANALAQLRHLA